jgi:hypothetical protein
MTRETLATAAVCVGVILTTAGAALIGGLDWAMLAVGVQALILGLAMGWE